MPEIAAVAGHGEHRHHLGGGRDVESGLAGEGPVLAEPEGDAAQDAVFDVETATPRDRGRVDPELVAMHEMRVDRGREQVVRRCDRMQVAGEVEIDVFAGTTCASPAPVPPPFAPSVGPTEGSRRQTSEFSPMWPSPSVRRDRGRRLAFAALSWA